MIRSLLWILLAAYVLQLQVSPAFTADRSFNIVWEQNGEEAPDEGADETEGLIKSQNPLNDGHAISEIIHRTSYEYFSLNFSREITIPPPKA
ncbi:MAG: hypothetical protein FJZ78_00055 [Bacteroidetes bacterium]|nr:hypothetical protein [Bacteroidota bacterium]